ncbi:MAG: mechanosensitive ion channel family protein, partial [Acidobacteriota bacterium]
VRLTHVFLVILVLIVVLSTLGVETTSLVALLGAGGLAVGLALQGALSNVASGVMLIVFRPFDVGDVVELDGDFLIVDEISLFTTRTHTPENIYTVVPNNQIWGNKIKNYARNPTRRISFTVGIGYGDDIGKAMEVLRNVVTSHPAVLTDPEPTIDVIELADSSVNLIVWPWTKREDFWRTKLDLGKQIKEALDAAGINIPYPQQDLHVHMVNE